jgi:hypothetical protein
VNIETGEVVGRDGDLIVSGCWDWIASAYHIGPDDLLSVR